jgi:hypothetical protein
LLASSFIFLLKIYVVKNKKEKKERKKHYAIEKNTKRNETRKACDMIRIKIEEFESNKT